MAGWRNILWVLEFLLSFDVGSHFFKMIGLLPVVEIILSTTSFEVDDFLE